jgi:serine/threonine protein kinase
MVSQQAFFPGELLLQTLCWDRYFIVLRDLKPANIMRTPTGQLYLIDLGIARYFKPGQAKDTVALGSPAYAAPEQYGKAQTTPRADIYSLGAVLLHEMSTLWSYIRQSFWRPKLGYTQQMRNEGLSS